MCALHLAEREGFADRRGVWDAVPGQRPFGASPRLREWEQPGSNAGQLPRVTSLRRYQGQGRRFGGESFDERGSSANAAGAVQVMYTLLTRLSQPVSIEFADEFAVVVPGYSGVPPLAPS